MVHPVPLAYGEEGGRSFQETGYQEKPVIGVWHVLVHLDIAVMSLALFQRDQTRLFILSEFRSCVKVEVAVLGPVPNKCTVSVDVKQHFIITRLNCRVLIT